MKKNFFFCGALLPAIGDVCAQTSPTGIITIVPSHLASEIYFVTACGRDGRMHTEKVIIE